MIVVVGLLAVAACGNSTGEAGVRAQLLAGDLEGVRERGPAAKDELIVCLADDDGTVRVNAAIALGMLGTDGASAVPAMLAAMEHDESRTRIAYAIAELREAGLPFLVEHVGAEDPIVRRYAVLTLAQGGYGTAAAAATPALISIIEGAADDALKTNALLALAATGTPAEPALPAIRRLAATTTGPLRVQAQNAIRRIEDARKPGP